MNHWWCKLRVFLDKFCCCCCFCFSYYYWCALCWAWFATTCMWLDDAIGIYIFNIWWIVSLTTCWGGLGSLFQISTLFYCTVIYMDKVKRENWVPLVLGVICTVYSFVAVSSYYIFQFSSFVIIMLSYVVISLSYLWVSTKLYYLKFHDF